MMRLTQNSWRRTPNYYPELFEKMFEAIIDDFHLRVGTFSDSSLWGPFEYLKISMVSYTEILMDFMHYPGQIVSTELKLEVIRTLPMFGPDFVGLEIYPPETRLVNEANIYHLWMFKRTQFKPPFTLNGQGIQHTPQGNIIHEWLPPIFDWAQKQFLKNQKYGSESCGIDILDPQKDLVHFVCLPRTISVPSELTL